MLIPAAWAMPRFFAEAGLYVQKRPPIPAQSEPAPFGDFTYTQPGAVLKKFKQSRNPGLHVSYGNFAHCPA